MKKCACHVLSSNACFTVKYQDVSKHEAGQRSGILVQFLHWYLLSLRLHDFQQITSFCCG